jgi:hypothetical protein
VYWTILDFDTTGVDLVILPVVISGVVLFFETLFIFFFPRTGFPGDFFFIFNASFWFILFLNKQKKPLGKDNPEEVVEIHA